MDKQFVPEVRIDNLPDLSVAYIRSRGPYHSKTIGPIFKQLMQWASPRELIELIENGSMVFSVFWSNPGITPEDKLIHDACITVPESIRADRWVDVQVLPGGKFSFHCCEIDVDHTEEVWMSFASETGSHLYS